MGFFISPKTVLRMVKNRSEICKYAKKKDKNWYFSEDGKAEYNEKETVADKCVFFYDYLCAAANGDVRLLSKNDLFFRTAYIMAHSMVGSSLAFGGYPNVIDPEINPIVKKVISDKGYSGNDVPDMLSALHGTDVQKYSAPRAHEALSFCKAGEPLTDLYKVERDIIAVFSQSTVGFGYSSKNSLYFKQAPYSYDIIVANTEEVSRNAEEDEYDE